MNGLYIAKLLLAEPALSEATFKVADEVWHFIRTGDEECQFYREGDTPSSLVFNFNQYWSEVEDQTMQNLQEGIALDAINGRSPEEWAGEIAYRLWDDAGYEDEETAERLATVLVESPLLGVLVGTEIIEDEYFED